MCVFNLFASNFWGHEKVLGKCNLNMFMFPHLVKLYLTCLNKFNIKVQKNMVLGVCFSFLLHRGREENRKIKNQEAAETLTVCELQSDARLAAQGWIPDRKRFCKDCDACLAGHKVQSGHA